MNAIAFWSVWTLAMLATCAASLPPGCNTREKAYLTAMKSDLRNMAVLQEAFRAEHGRFASMADIQALKVPLYQSTGINLVLETADASGWRAATTHIDVKKMSCSMGAGYDMPICIGAETRRALFTGDRSLNFAIDCWLCAFTLARRRRRLHEAVQ